MSSQKSNGKVMVKLRSLDKRLWVAILSTLLLAAPASSWAKDGAITLRGSIVNSSCMISSTEMTAPGVHSRTLEVAPGVTIHVSTERNVCGEQAMPFVTQYQVLPAAVLIDGEALQASAAVVTLSYQ
ncbi:MULTISPECIES: hypothetical protein [Pseudomonas]|uniref:Type 1 fimbrial protein n=1 Tax=Pseudomonas syringae UB303 TaxID=1357287 RepID=A0AAJ4B210_PSESX|nr:MULTISPECIES: hypothetical protein [Pseudomonas]KTB83786.1 hypothetical protein AO069_01270 [Pseudomonas syringae pv. syringae PD2774]KWS10745.1 hypothetical protein AL064_12975 [Pseudomonas syringae pv. syringae]MCA5967224.1 hypothetical protein [Pseudomonas sp. P129]MCA5971716.1 hypothetical protein [Pseudomonas sp. P135]MCF4982913.1 hypothetical protein [Pseudomonas syringae]